MEMEVTFIREQTLRTLPSNPLIGRALRFLMENSQDEISLDCLSQHLRCSKFYLVKCFRVYLNITPMRWLLHFRLKRAAERLQQQEPIAMVNLALECGFGSHSHFSTLFRKHYGCSPTEYQRNFRHLPIDSDFESIVSIDDENLLQTAFQTP